MAHREISRPQSENSAVTEITDIDDLRKKIKASTNSMANVTLVKPMQTEDASENTITGDNGTSKSSLTRPKLGRFPSPAPVDTDTTQKAISPAQERLLMTQTHGAKKHKDIYDEPAYDLIGLEPSRPWDFKFALFLVALLVVINLGLVMLLHNNHAQQTVLNRHGKAVNVVEASATPAQTVPAPTLKVTETVVPASSVASALSTTPVPASSSTQASAPLKDLPALAPAAGQTAPASAPVAATVNAPAAPAADPAAARQDLLSIISKD